MIKVKKYTASAISWLESIRLAAVRNGAYFLNGTPSGPTRRKKPRPKQTYLMYDAASGYYKIGRSINPAFREDTLAAQIPMIETLATCQIDIERQLHDRFAAKRIRGEWFDLDEEDLMHILERFEQINTEFAERLLKKRESTLS